MWRYIVICAVVWGSHMTGAAQTDTGQQFSNRVGAPVSQAVEQLKADQYGQALSTLDKALGLGDLTPYELATIQQMRGSAFYELDRLSEAISAFENAYSSGGLEKQAADTLNLQIAQLMIADKRPEQGALRFESWVDQGGQLRQAQIKMLMQAWVQAENYKRALPWAEKWFGALADKQREDFDVLNFLYHTLELSDKQSALVQDMIEKWPDERALWESWASLLSQAGRDDDAFEVNRLMYKQGLMTSEKDILKLVQYHGYFDIPYWGAKILTTEIEAGRVQETPDTLKKLSDLWRQAREYDRAIPVLEKTAKLDRNAKTYAELAEAYINQGVCKKAETAFTQAIELGYPSGKPWMLIGTCRYEQAQIHPKPECAMDGDKRSQTKRVLAQTHAHNAFENVDAPASLRVDAQKWMSFIKAEQKAVDDRCEWLDKQRVTTCFLEIERAYDGIIFTQGAFELEDETCEAFKKDYDLKHRKSQPAASLPTEG